MRHLGDITKISGYEVPIVDCIIGGVPAKTFRWQEKEQDLTERGQVFIWNKSES